MLPFQKVEKGCVPKFGVLIFNLALVIKKWPHKAGSTVLLLDPTHVHFLDLLLLTPSSSSSAMSCFNTRELVAKSHPRAACDLLLLETATGCLQHQAQRFHDTCSNMQPDIVVDIVGNSSFTLSSNGGCQNQHQTSRVTLGSDRQVGIPT